MRKREIDYCVFITCLIKGGRHGEDLIITTEMYLKTILELEEDGSHPACAIVDRALRPDGLADGRAHGARRSHVMGDRRLELTEADAHATGCASSGASILLPRRDSLGMDWVRFTTKACAKEHAMSDAVERLQEAAEQLMDHGPIRCLAEQQEGAIPRTGGSFRGRHSHAGAHRREPIQAGRGAAGLSFDGLRHGARVELSAHGDVVRVAALGRPGTSAAT